MAKNFKDGQLTTFKAPVTSTKTLKIYIIKQKSEVVYVGYASQSIGLRLGQDIRTNGQNGLHGYISKKQMNQNYWYLNLIIN